MCSTNANKVFVAILCVKVNESTYYIMIQYCKIHAIIYVASLISERDCILNIALYCNLSTCFYSSQALLCERVHPCY